MNVYTDENNDEFTKFTSDKHNLIDWDPSNA